MTSPETTYKVIATDSSRKEALNDTLTHAFMTDPYMRYIIQIDDEARMFPKLRWLLRQPLSLVLRGAGVVYTTPDTRGAAVWMQPGYTIGLKAFFTLNVYQGPFRISPGATLRYLRYESKLDAIHEQAVSAPHWYLFLLGVAPDYQGQGIGSALMQPVLQQADAAGQICFLETMNPHNVPLYQKHGFAIVSETRPVGDAGPVAWSMLREPK